jgi:hypothetical protein
MQSARTFAWHAHAAALTCAAAVALAGCGMPGAPQPPSLNLPVPVNDLSAVRAGDHVTLAWSMPTRNTDKLLLDGNVAVRICRNQSSSANCSAIAALQLAPGADGSFNDALPSALAIGSPRILTYRVELDNRKGRSAGLSNSANVLAGGAPLPVTDLTAAVRPDGILLSWAAAPPGTSPTPIRLERKLLTPSTKKPAQGPLAPAPEPAEQNLLVESGPQADRALDSHIRFGETYEYRAQRFARVTVNGQTLELASAFSSPLRIDAENTFPPAVPTSLVAAATPAANGEPPAIDLSWLPVPSPDLAGYIIYRREPPAANGTAVPTNGSSSLGWQRISPTQPVVGPAWHDAAAQPGHTYQYAVSSIGQNGRESARSNEAQETVPAE